MPIIVNLDVMMARRKMSLNELSEKVGLTLSNLSILKTGKAKAVRFSTLGDHFARCWIASRGIYWSIGTRHFLCDDCLGAPMIFLRWARPQK